MPTITVTAPKGALDKAVRDALMKRLSDTLLKWEGADVSSPVAQSIAWTYYNEAPADGFYVGGVATSDPRFKIDVTTPQGALTEDTRGELAKEIGEIVEDMTGAAGAGLNHWVLFHEINDGAWAAAGRIVRRADIAAILKASAATQAA